MTYTRLKGAALLIDIPKKAQPTIQPTLSERSPLEVLKTIKFATTELKHYVRMISSLPKHPDYFSMHNGLRSIYLAYEAQLKSLITEYKFVRLSHSLPYASIKNVFDNDCFLQFVGSRSSNPLK